MITHSTIDQNLKIDPSIYQWIVTHCPLFLGSPDWNRMATLVELRLTGQLLASTELQSFNHCGQYEVNLHSPKLLCRQSFSLRVSSRIPSGPINYKYLTTNYPSCKELFLKSWIERNYSWTLIHRNSWCFTRSFGVLFVTIPSTLKILYHHPIRKSSLTVNFF